MEFFKENLNIDFMHLRKSAAWFSTVLCILSIIGLVLRGLNFGLDFTGGTQVELHLSQPTAITEIRHTLEEKGFSGSKVQQYGTPEDIVIRLANTHGVDEKTLGAQLVSIMKGLDAGVTLKRTEFVGSEVGEQLVEQGTLAVFVAIIAIMLYIAFRFEFRLGLSAAIGLCHDVLIVLGVFAWARFEFDLATLASVLAVIGYSLNDTIVVFDRIRESFRKVRRRTSAEIINLSINQTLSRTVMTSLLTLLVVLALLAFGGPSLFGFSMAFLLGIVIGTYSSIFVAGALALRLGLSKQDLMPKAAIVDGMP